MAGRGCVATYIWPGAEGATDIRTLRRVLQSTPTTVEEVPVACFDGAQTGQASIRFSSIMLKPVGLFHNTYEGEGILVLCQTMDPPGPQDKGAYISPHPTNNRAPCERVMSEAAASQPTFVVVQEYSIWDGLTQKPLGAKHGSTRHSSQEESCIATFCLYLRVYLDSHGVLPSPETSMRRLSIVNKKGDGISCLLHRVPRWQYARTQLLCCGLQACGWTKVR
jgi:hypothetical protein